ncbi:hypothetical protein MBLNU459_g4015t1 [Dothideomycetes sp. NU459]
MLIPRAKQHHSIHLYRADLHIADDELNSIRSPVPVINPFAPNPAIEEKVLLFSSLLRQGRQFAAYNFREYAQRRTCDAFREHVAETDSRRVQELMQKGIRDLQMLKRQTVVSQFFQLDRLVVEGGKTGKQTGSDGGIVRQKDQGFVPPDAATAQVAHRRIMTCSKAYPSDNGGNQKRQSVSLQFWKQQKALLREARRPRLAKRKQEPAEDEKGEEEEEADKDVQTGWQAKKWSQLPVHLEEPDREYLAKRRKGLPSMHAAMALQAAAAVVSSAPTRKTKVAKLDADGNTTVYEVLVPEGQVIVGEVVEDTVMADAAPEKAAPGTIIEGVGIANAEGLIVATDLLQPPKRKNMPPKRTKKGGPGRGKKKVMFTGTDGRNGTGQAPGSVGSFAPKVDGSNGDGSAMDVDPTPKADGEDTEGHTGEGDGDDDEDDVEEGDDDDDREDGELSDTEAPGVSTGPATPAVLPAAPPAPGSAAPNTAPTVDTADAFPTSIPQGQVEIEPNSTQDEPKVEALVEAPVEAPVEASTEAPVELPANLPVEAPPIVATAEDPAQVMSSEDTSRPTSGLLTSEPLAEALSTAPTSDNVSLLPAEEHDPSSSPERPLAQNSDGHQHPLVAPESSEPVAPPVVPATEALELSAATESDIPSGSAAPDLQASEPEVLEPQIIEPSAVEPTVLSGAAAEPQITEEAATEPQIIEEAVAEPQVGVTEEAVADPQVEVTEEAVADPQVEVAEEAVADPQVEVTEEAVAEPQVTGEAADEEEEDLLGKFEKELDHQSGQGP